MSNFYIGQKVVCVDASPSPFCEVPLMRGNVYTVKNVIDGGVALQLNEVSALYEQSGKGFWCRRFRPIDSLTEQVERIESEGAPVEEPEPCHA